MRATSDPAGRPSQAPVYDRVASYYDRWMQPCERAGLARLRARALAEVAPALVERGGGRRLLEVGAGALGYAFDALSLVTGALMDDHFNRRTADEARRAGLEVLTVEKHMLGIVQLIVCRVE